MAVGAITMTSERAGVVDFTGVPFYENTGLQMLIKDDWQPLSMFVFTAVFTFEVWTVWLTLLLGSAIIIYCFYRLKYNLCSTCTSLNPHNNPWGLVESIWFAVTTFSMAGPEESPHMPSCRVFVAGFWFFSQIIMATYTANLAAFLTNSRLVKPITNFNDLLSHPNYRYSLEQGSRAQSYFKRMAHIEDDFYKFWKDSALTPKRDKLFALHPVWEYPLTDKYKKMWDSMEKTGFVDNMEEGIQKVLEGNFALFLESPIIKYEMSKRCGLRTAGEVFSLKNFAFVLPQQSPLRAPISNVTLTLQSETVLTKLKEKWWSKDTSVCTTVEETDGLPLSAVGGIFIVMVVGVIMSFISLTLEIIRARHPCSKGKSIDLHVNRHSQETTAIGIYEVRSEHTL